MTGFIDPAFDLEMPNIASDDLSGCQLFDFPSVCELLLDDLVVPMSSDTLELQHTQLHHCRESQEKKRTMCDILNSDHDIHGKLVHDKLNSVHPKLDNSLKVII